MICALSKGAAMIVFKRSLASCYAVRHCASYKRLVDVQPQVQAALEGRQPVVALESTIITHGMPYPQNLETACEVEELVRANGATPATIAILDGRIKVGLCAPDLAKLAAKPTSEVIKCSRRDLAYVLAHQKCGGTTVSATMLIAHMVGVRVFATGGIGGVHRNGQDTLDISADLVELGRTPVTVVCSGVKSILDIPRTLEYLETQGVCTATFGSAERRFPDFYTQDSGCQVPYNLDTPAAAARLIASSHALALQSGILIAVPIPAAHAADKQRINAAIDEAYRQAEQQGVSGKDLTPFLLAAIAQITDGNSLQANMALIKNNAMVAAQIARELSRIECEVEDTGNVATPLVIGASILDLSLTVSEELPEALDGATYNTQAKQSAGGVGRNLAEGLYKLYGKVNFLSAVGNDHLGQSLLQLMPATLRTRVAVNTQQATSLCSVIFDKAGECKLILGNMEIHQSITPEQVRQQEQLVREAPLIVIDGNLSLPTIECVLQLAQQHKRPVFFEPTDMRIAAKPFSLPRSLTQQIKITSPNVHELKAIVEALSGQQVQWQPKVTVSTETLLHEVKQLVLTIQQHFDCLLVTLGQHGVLLSLRAGQSLFKTDKVETHNMQFFAAPQVKQLANVSGAGDSFSSGFMTGLLRGYSVERAVTLGFIAAERALKSASAVPGTYFSSKEQELQELERRFETLHRQSI